MNSLHQEESTSLREALLQIENLPKSNHAHFLRIPLNHSVDVLSWVRQHTHKPFVYWSSRNKKEEWGGIDLAESHYPSIQEAQERLKSLDPSIRAFGGMSFSSQSDGWGEFGSQSFWIPKICVYRKDQEFFIEYLKLPHQKIKSCPPTSLLPHRYIPSQEDWTQIIDKTYEDLQQDRLHKIVLARQSRLKLSFSALEARSPLQVSMS